MTNTPNENQKRRFAAKYRSRWQGWLALVFGITSTTNGEIYGPILGVPLVVFGIYLLRGQGLSPKSIERAKKKADKLQSKIDAATRDLETAQGGQAVVAYRNLEEVLKSTKLPDYQNTLERILQDIKFDKSKLNSDRIGIISGPGIINRNQVEVFKDWVIYGQSAFDIEPSTRGEVHVEGNVQLDQKGNKHDMRTASMQFVSSSWSKTFPINLNGVTEARRIVAQLSVVTDSLKPAGVTTADITKMIETILSNSGQPPAEKLKQLSDLRFQRLLSDSEFEAAKARILGI